MTTLLKTKRLRLEPISEQHLCGLFPHFSNPLITPFLAWEPHKDIEQSRQVLHSLLKGQDDGKALHWTIICNGNVCGLISLIDIKRSHLSWTIDRAELAYWLAPEFQKKGLMQEACARVVDYAFADQEFNKVVVAHAEDNTESKKIIARLNFSYVGLERQAFKKHGVWHNLLHYELLASDYEKHRNSAS